jgi:hypothetical protein
MVVSMAMLDAQKKSRAATMSAKAVGARDGLARQEMKVARSEARDVARVATGRNIPADPA